MITQVDDRSVLRPGRELTTVDISDMKISTSSDDVLVTYSLG